MDEAHKTVGDGEKLFSHLLHDKNLIVRRRIFMTATERRYRGKGDKILSMDNAAIYGDTFHLLSFKRALESKPAILSDYRIVTILVSREEVAELIRKNVFVKPDKGRWNKEIEAEMLASLVALRKAMQKYPIRHAVSFHSSIQRAEIFKEHNEVYNEAFKKHGTIETFHVSGKTPTGTRARIVNEFAGTDRGLITNARCLTEGIDVPDIDCVMFADPRRSAVDIVQAVGRALRPAKGKKMGYVIVPILHDTKAKPDDIFKSEEFQEILTTLRALAANDERIIEYFRSIFQGKRKNGGGSVAFELDEAFAKRINLAEFARNIELRCWNRMAALSWRKFEDARDFVRKLGLRNGAEWSRFCQGTLPEKGFLPADIPAAPQYVYAGKGWAGQGDWLGTGFIAWFLRDYRPFLKARSFARSLKLKSGSEWKQFCRGTLAKKGKLPSDISANPNQTYAGKGWAGMGDWLGTGAIATRDRSYRNFESARKFVRALALKSQAEWFLFTKGKLSRAGRLPRDIPKAPQLTYSQHGWGGWGDWLGTGNPAPGTKKYRSFQKARRYVRSLHLESARQWRAFYRGALKAKGMFPSDIPVNPDIYYKHRGWTTWGDWLGTGRIADNQRGWRPFKQARAYVHQLRLKGQSDWSKFKQGTLKGAPKKPQDIPSSPSTTYAGKGWISWGDWFGTNTTATRLRKYRSFTDARKFARELHLQTEEEWLQFCRGERPELGKLPDDMPVNAYQTYAGKGWKGYPDFLGKRIAKCGR